MKEDILLFYRAQAHEQDHYWAARTPDQVNSILDNPDYRQLTRVSPEEAQKARILKEINDSGDLVGALTDLAQHKPVYLGTSNQTNSENQS